MLLKHVSNSKKKRGYNPHFNYDWAFQAQSGISRARKGSVLRGFGGDESTNV